MSTLASVFGYGLLSARPAASVAGRFYYATDTTFMYRDNGSTWDTLSVGAGSMAADPLWDAAGDLAQGTGANTGAKLSAGTAGQFLMSAGAAAANLWASNQLSYVEFTSPVTVTATVEASATTIVTGASIAFDGSTPAMIEFFAPDAQTAAVAGDYMQIILFDGSSAIGVVCFLMNQTTTTGRTPLYGVRRLTPSNASHTYSFRGIVNNTGGTVTAGAAGAGNRVPGFIRITRAV